MIGKKTKIEKHKDDRGLLMTINHIPFETKRMFIISDVPSNSTRGNHFSRTSGFLYTVIKGACTVELDDGNNTEIHRLEAGDRLQFPKRTWMRLSAFEKDTVLCVLADKEYDSYDYVSDYEEFKRIVREEYV